MISRFCSFFKVHQCLIYTQLSIHRIQCLRTSYFHYHISYANLFYFIVLKVKVWFQNRRTKARKVDVE